MENGTISDDWTYKGMRVVYMENSFLRIGILVDRGSDIFEFTFKPLAIDPLLRLPKGIKNPALDFSQIRNTSNQFEDYYYGGWQEILPNSPPFNYRGAAILRLLFIKVIGYILRPEKWLKRNFQRVLFKSSNIHYGINFKTHKNFC